MRLPRDVRNLVVSARVELLRLPPGYRHSLVVLTSDVSEYLSVHDMSRF